MTAATTAELVAAHDGVAAAIGAIPDAALDWQPGGGAWSLKQVIGHLATANDFYLMVVEEARAADFGAVRLHSGLAGWQRALAADAEVARGEGAPAALDCFERAYRRLLAVLEGLTSEELDRPFVFLDQQPGEPPATTTTLRERVLARAVGHLREHQAQLADTLARWRAAAGP